MSVYNNSKLFKFLIYLCTLHGVRLPDILNSGNIFIFGSLLSVSYISEYTTISFSGYTIALENVSCMKSFLLSKIYYHDNKEMCRKMEIFVSISKQCICVR